MKKIKILFVSLLCAVMLFGCTGIPGITTGGQTTEPATSTSADDERITLVSGGAAMFKIVTGDMENYENAKNLQDALKTKTKVTFELEVYDKNKEYGSVIYVGRNTSIKELDDYYRENIGNSGYAAAYMDGNIYICGYTPDTVSQAVIRFASNIVPANIVTNENNKVNAYLTAETFFLYNPGKEVENAQMLGNNFGKYNFVVAAKESATYIELVTLIKNEVGRRTGSYIELVKDTAAKTEYEIVFGNTNREVSARLYTDGKYIGDTFDFSLESGGNSLAVGFGSRISLYCIIDEIMELVKTDEKTVSKKFSAKDIFLSSLPLEKTDGATMRIMTSNVLFASNKWGDISSKLRMELLAEYYIALDCDVVGLQEVHADNQKYLTIVLSELYAFVPFMEAGKNCFESTIYRTDRYTLEDYGYIPLDYANMPNNRYIYQFTWAVLKSIETGEIYVHGNLHYHYYSEADRLIQTPMVNAELKKLLAAYPDAIFVITGDYNSKLDSTVHNDMTAGTVMKNAIHAAPEGKTDPSSPGLIDHFMVNPDTTKVYFHKVITDVIITRTSDHKPIIIDISGKIN